MKHNHPHPEEIQSVSLNEKDLTIPEIIAVARYGAKVRPFRGTKREKLTQVRNFIEKNWFVKDAPPKYGFNTGVGSLKNVQLDPDDIEPFQENYIKSHSVGVGEPLSIEIVRAAMLLQAQALSRGFSGVRGEVVDKLIEMLNKHIHPVVPSQGSLGASGDLAPLTHIATVLTGEDEAQIWVGDKKIPLKQLKTEKGFIQFQRGQETVTFQPLRLHGKEAISLTNATSVMLAIAVLLIYDVEILLKNADMAAALSLEAMMCEPDAFTEELHQIRNQKGQIVTAKNIRNLIANSKRMTPEARMTYFKTLTDKKLAGINELKENPQHAEFLKLYTFKYEFEKNRVQDAYSLRCIPQVHGACKDTFHFVKEIIERETQAVTDNPVIFPDKGGHGYVVISGGNFHGEPLAFAMDFLAIALAEIGNIAERRIFRLLSPALSYGLPRNLSGGKIGLNTGLMMTQYTAAQLASENKVLAHPASVDSIPTSENQEDHVSMGMIAANKALKVMNNVQYINAIEYLCGVQALQLSAMDKETDLKHFPLGRGTHLLFDFLIDYHVESSQFYPFKLIMEDEFLQTRMEQIKDMAIQGKAIKAVQKEIELMV